MDRFHGDFLLQFPDLASLRGNVRPSRLLYPRAKRDSFLAKFVVLQPRSRTFVYGCRSLGREFNRRVERPVAAPQHGDSHRIRRPHLSLVAQSDLWDEQASSFPECLGSLLLGEERSLILKSQCVCFFARRAHAFPALHDASSADLYERGPSIRFGRTRNHVCFLVGNTPCDGFSNLHAKPYSQSIPCENLHENRSDSLTSCRFTDYRQSLDNALSLSVGYASRLRHITQTTEGKAVKTSCFSLASDLL